MFKEEEVNGLILNVVPMRFKNEGKEDSVMTCITYALPATSSDRFKGFAILRGYANADAFNKLDNVVKSNMLAKIKIETRPTESGSKFYINSVNGIACR